MESNSIKYRPILFSAPMVRAILEGRKAQTRRVVKNIPKIYDSWDLTVHECYDVMMSDDKDAAIFLAAGDQGWADWHECPYGKPGDRLYVRETWAPADAIMGDGPMDPPCVIACRADETMWLPNGKKLDTYGVNFDKIHWRPSIHMPRAAARIILEITGVRVERLTAISEADALAEGVKMKVAYKDDDEIAQGFEDYLINDHLAYDARRSFATLWKSINGPESWDANPWVWVVSFKKVDQ